VPIFGGTASNFQIVLRAYGLVELPLLAVGVADRAVVGLSAGPCTGAAPAETDFVAPVPEDCGSGADEDFDLLVDCADPDCFGHATYCATEALCSDGEDNDDDSLTDCDDSDCDAALECQPVVGIYEFFDVSTGETFDLTGTTLTFTPDAADPNGYTWTATSGVTAFPETPGSGTMSTGLALSDDAFEEVPLTTMGSFDFFGSSQTSLFVGSNGYVTFGAGDRDFMATVANHFDFVGISALRGDLDPSDGGTITVDDYADRAVITFDGVPQYAVGGGGALSSFQTVVRSSGVIEIHYVDIGSTRDHVVGLSSGGLGSTYPAETDYVTP